MELGGLVNLLKLIGLWIEDRERGRHEKFRINIVRRYVYSYEYRVRKRRYEFASSKLFFFFFFSFRFHAVRKGRGPFNRAAMMLKLNKLNVLPGVQNVCEWNRREERKESNRSITLHREKALLPHHASLARWTLDLLHNYKACKIMGERKKLYALPNRPIQILWSTHSFSCCFCCYSSVPMTPSSDIRDNSEKLVA